MSRISIFNRQSIVEFYYEGVKLKAPNKTDYVIAQMYDKYDFKVSASGVRRLIKKFKETG